MVESHRQEIAKLEALYASNPGGRVFVHLAEALRRAGEHERARSILEEGLARHPDSASGYVVLGRVMIDRGDAAAADSAFRKVLQLDGGNLVALRCLGDLARTGGRPTEAMSFYRELIARNPASEGDEALMRLMDEAQRSAAAAALAAVASEHEAAQAAQAAAAAQQSAAAEAAPAEVVAPGRAGRALPAEPEFGMIELDALPGDLASFAGLATRQPTAALDEPEPEPRGLEDDVVVLIESSAAPLQLEELETQLAASAAEVNLLSAAPELELPVASEPLAEYAPWTDEPLAESTTAPQAAHVPGDIDMAAAMLNVSQLAAATPFELVPEATELTLVDDDTVRVAMTTAEPAAAEAAAEEVLHAVEEPASGEPATPEEPAWAAASTQVVDDARTQDTADLAPADAVEIGYEDLPWLVEPSEAAGMEPGATGVGEEPPVATEAGLASAGFPFDVAADLAPAAADEAAGDQVAVPVEIGDTMEPSFADAAAGVADDFAVPLELVGEFEAPAEQIAADEPSWTSAMLDELEVEAAPDHAAAGEDVEVAADLAASHTGFIETPRDFASDTAFLEIREDFGAEAEPLETADLAAFAEPIERVPDLFPFTEPAETAPDLPAFAEPIETALDQGAFTEPVEPVADIVAFTEPIETAPEPAAFGMAAEAPPDQVTYAEAEPERELFALDIEPAEQARAKFAEDVEAEPDLDTRLEEIGTGRRNAAGFVPDAEFAAFEERRRAEADRARLAQDIDFGPRDVDHMEDVEAEAELAGFADELEAEPGFTEEVELSPGFAAFLDEAGTVLERDLTIEEVTFEGVIFETPAEEIAATVADFMSPLDELLEPFWTDSGSDFSPVDVAPLGADIGVPEPPYAVPAAGEDVGAPEPYYEPAEAAAGADATGAELGTETLADLYRAQGFAERAAEVYRALLEQRPADERLAAKLRDAEAALIAGHGATAEDAGDVWLRGVEAAWTGGAGATGEETTPYAWTEREEREQGTGISAYLRDLISWGTGELARAEDAGARPMLGAEAAPAGSAPVADEPRRAAAEPDRRDEPDAWTTEWADEELESQPSPGPWSMTPEPVLDETWGAAEPPQPWSPTAEPPPDPWLAPEPTAVRGGPAEAAHATAPNPVEEAFNEWFGPPSEPAAPAGAQPPMETGDEERSDEAAAEDESDEDLEMFRAWLQSLKK